MDERLRFVARLLEGEKMAVLCREFGISRKTGYKIFNRYKELGLVGHASVAAVQREKIIFGLGSNIASMLASKETVRVTIDKGSIVPLQAWRSVSGRTARACTRLTL